MITCVLCFDFGKQLGPVVVPLGYTPYNLVCFGFNHFLHQDQLLDVRWLPAGHQCMHIPQMTCEIWQVAVICLASLRPIANRCLLNWWATSSGYPFCPGSSTNKQSQATNNAVFFCTKIQKNWLILQN